MIVYRLNINRAEHDAEGEDWNEYFTSLAGAKRRRAQLIAAGIAENWEDSLLVPDFAIDRVTIASLSRARLALAILNRTGWVAADEEVVPPYEIKVETEPVEPGLPHYGRRPVVRGRAPLKGEGNA